MDRVGWYCLLEARGLGHRGHKKKDELVFQTVLKIVALREEH